MSVGPASATPSRVALLAEGVDRNSVKLTDKTYTFVALLAEGVDRNSPSLTLQVQGNVVALLAEGVDRNSSRSTTLTSALGRPPRGGRG